MPAMRLLVLLLTTAIASAANVTIESARPLFEAKKYADAKAELERIVAADPKNAEAESYLSRTAIELGDADAAIAHGEKACALAPSNSEYQRLLGEAYGFTAQKAGALSKIGWAKKCRLAFEKAVQLDPANVDAHDSLMGFYQQAPGFMGGGMDRAYAQAAEIKKLDPTRGRLAYATLYTSEKKYHEALAALDELLNAVPDNYGALYQVGRIAALSGDEIDRGIMCLQKCLTLIPAPNTPRHDAAHWRLGNLWEKKGDKTAARAAYQAALAVTPKFQPAIDALKKLDSK